MLASNLAQECQSGYVNKRQTVNSEENLRIQLIKNYLREIVLARCRTKLYVCVQLAALCSVISPRYRVSKTMNVSS